MCGGTDISGPCREPQLLCVTIPSLWGCFLQHGPGSPHSLPAPLSESWASRCRWKFLRLRSRQSLCPLGWEDSCFLFPGVCSSAFLQSPLALQEPGEICFPSSLNVSICEPGWLVSNRSALELYQEAALCARPRPGPAENKPPARDIFRHSLIK